MKDDWFSEYFSEEAKKAMAEKKLKNQEVFSFLTASEKLLLEQISQEHRTTIEIEFKPTPSGSSCTVSSNDLSKVKWVTYLMNKHRESVKGLNLLLLRNDDGLKQVSPAMESDFHDILNLAFGILGMNHTY
jgi:hypothetical protein